MVPASRSIVADCEPDGVADEGSEVMTSKIEAPRSRRKLGRGSGGEADGWRPHVQHPHNQRSVLGGRRRKSLARKPRDFPARRQFSFSSAAQRRPATREISPAPSAEKVAREGGVRFKSRWILRSEKGDVNHTHRFSAWHTTDSSPHAFQTKQVCAEMSVLGKKKGKVPFL